MLKTVTYYATAVSSVEKTDGESNLAAQDMLQRKNSPRTNKDTKAFQNVNPKPIVYGKQCATSA